MTSTDEILDQLAGVLARPGRAPVLRTPGELGLEYEDLTFPATDGVQLEAWYIPRPGSTELVIVNHPLQFNRYGYPSHLEPWRTFGAAGGNTFEVDYMEDYRILHEAGYHVLTYDMRNFGLSPEANGGIAGRRFEARDVVGSLRFARTDERLRDLTVGLFSRCNGANATFWAMEAWPEEFEDVRCLVAPQPLSAEVTMRRLLDLIGIPDRLGDLEQQVRLKGALPFAQLTPVPAAAAVTVPTFLYQVRDDVMTEPSDVQAMYDAIPQVDKKLMWIEGTTARWDGYLEFQRRPEPMLEWFRTHMK
ncbi:alpha/beta hydrolase family protein [Actinoplanes derwentensis]|uniref:Alpha/beta hydrolase family protein n=1 Tax=Actinoplanes derwentensis TaxID=113562 RepID=A0A1H2DBC3_9ACTN|nr:alpha/beta hydrolase [Actinoplanes derwentensis]GID90031.1 hypothetical protein Ade03nite_89550 [Actinoplanes derwentensis]SDT80038.1 hypothetical protein SAMN04489716_9035 [Actinoplanes derwentensis]